MSDLPYPRADIEAKINQWQSRYPTSGLTVSSYTFDVPDNIDRDKYKAILIRALEGARQFRSAAELTARAILDLRILIDPHKEYGDGIYHLPCYRQAIEAIVTESGVPYASHAPWMRKVREKLPPDHPWYVEPKPTLPPIRVQFVRTELGTLVDISRGLRTKLSKKLELEESIQYAGPDVLLEEIDGLMNQLFTARDYVHKRKSEGAVRTERVRKDN